MRRLGHGVDLTLRLCWSSQREDLELEPAPRTASSATWLAAAIIVIGAAAALWLNWPGHFSYDSVVQLSEGRTGDYSGEHPPVMSWLLGLADAIRPGAAPFIVLDVLLVDGALLALVLIARRGRWPLPIVAAAAFFLPQLIIYPAIVWKDVLFAGSACAGFAALAGAAEAWPRRGPRYGLLALGALMLALAALARQNGFVALPFAAAAVGWIAWRADHSASRVRAIALATVFLAAAVGVTLAANAALATRLETPDPLAGAWRGLEAYDLVAALDRDPGLDLPALSVGSPRSAALLRTKGVAAYSPARIDSIDPVMRQIGEDATASELIQREWRRLVLRRPLLYLEVRAEAFRWVFLTPRPRQCVLVETGVDGPAEEMALSGLRERDTLRDDAIGDYALGFAGTPVYSHGAYAAAGAVLLIFLVRRRRPADIAVAAMVASALAFAASFALISIACDYRYLYFLDLAVIAALLYAAASWGGLGPRSG